MPSSQTSKTSKELVQHEDKPEQPAIQPEEDASKAAKISNPQAQEPHSLDNVLNEVDQECHHDSDKELYEFMEGESRPPRRASAAEKRGTKPGEDPDVYDPKPEDFRRKRSTTEPTFKQTSKRKGCALGFGSYLVLEQSC